MQLRERLGDKAAMVHHIPQQRTRYMNEALEGTGALEGFRFEPKRLSSSSVARHPSSLHNARNCFTVGHYGCMRLYV